MVDNGSWENEKVENLTSLGTEEIAEMNCKKRKSCELDKDETITKIYSLKSGTDDFNAEEKIELFIGNLRPDMEYDLVIKRLQSLFSVRGINLNSEDFSGLKRGPKKAKHLFVAVKSEEDRQELINIFNGFTDLDFIAANKSLRVKERKSQANVIKKSKKSKTQDFEVGNFEDENRDFFVEKKLVESKSAPIMMMNAKKSANTVICVEGKALEMGQVLENESRRTEYKRGGGRYLKKNLLNHVRRYVCAFLNTEGGKLHIGVADNGKVYGIPCTRKQEDSIRIMIDSVISKFQPPVFPAMYSVRFIPVIPCTSEYNAKDFKNQCFKVLEIEVYNQVSTNTLYETDKGDVYIRRDGSVQGPLKASQIIEWCRFNQSQNSDTQQHNNIIQSDAMINKEASTDPGGNLNNVSTKMQGNSTDESMMRISELEASMNLRQTQLEKEIDALKLSYEMRERLLQEELEKSRFELRKRQRPSSAVCIIL